MGKAVPAGRNAPLFVNRSFFQFELNRIPFLDILYFFTNLLCSQTHKECFADSCLLGSIIIDNLIFKD